jgi:hypothetical protein
MCGWSEVQMTKEDVIKTIIDMEWNMFQDVQNIGGRAACQDELNTFRIMRASQAESWSEAVLESYRQDLTEAVKEGRNLMTEKYARMMKSTSPLEYANIEHLLPALSLETTECIEKIASIVLGWEAELFEKYPAVLKNGRPIHASDDTAFVTSLETYLKCELATYSPRTLKLYYEHVSSQKLNGTNASELTLLHTVRSYGYKTLAEANERLSRPS